MPDWLRVCAKPLRWAMWSEDKQKLIDHADMAKLSYDKLEFWDNRWWMGGVDGDIFNKMMNQAA